MPTITEVIVDADADGFARDDFYFETPAGTGFTSTHTDMKQGYTDDDFGQTSHFYSFLHFTTVAIPVGATITAAKIQMQHNGEESSSVGETFAISAEDVDSSSAPTTASDVIDATLTTASGTWTVASMSASTWYDSPELKTVIQEIVDRSGWASDNNITMIMHSNSVGDWYVRWWSRNKGTSYAPKLVVTYTEPDTTAPTADSFSPADNATDVAVTTDLVINFSENVQAGSGNIVIKKSSDDSTTHTIPVASDQVSGSTVTINPSPDLDAETGYYVQIDSGAFEDLSDNDYAGISDKTTWNFTTAEGEGGGSSVHPTRKFVKISSYNPAKSCTLSPVFGV